MSAGEGRTVAELLDDSNRLARDESAGNMIARFDAIEQLAAGSLAARRHNVADQPATGEGRPAMRLGAALAAWEIQAHRTLANQPDAADLVRVARVQAIIATTPSWSVRLPRDEARSTPAW